MAPARLGNLPKALLEVNPSRATRQFWLAASLFFALLYSSLNLLQAFAGPFVVQDDARQHVFWMQRYLDPTLFPDDLVADYFQSVAPLGYATLYKVMAFWGVSPLVFCKILPVFLCVALAALNYLLFLKILPVPAAGFASTLILLQALWMTDDLGSGTPRAFFYPLFLGFLWALLQRSWWGCAAMILLQGWFYPHTVLISAALAVARSLTWQHGRLRLVRERRDLMLLAIALGTAFLALLPFALETSAYGPTISVAEAKLLPEFQPGGRTIFFSSNALRYWIAGRSGFLPILAPVTLLAGLLLPFLMVWRAKIPLLHALSEHFAIVTQILLASTGMFFLAHLLLFRLHLPNRYSSYSLHLLLAWTAAIVLFALLDGVTRWAAADLPQLQSAIAGAACLVLGTIVIGYPASLNSFLDVNYVKPSAAEQELFAFLAEQPRDSLMVSLAATSSNIATLAGRPVLFSPEHAIPYQTGYYRQIRQRIRDTIHAQYAPDATALQETIRRYGIDFWILERRAFDREAIASNRWLQQYQPEAIKAVVRLADEEAPPRLQGLQARCEVFANAEYTVLSAECLLAVRSESAAALLR